ncbi:MAG: glucose 1-dehydrogenase [Betaproteobacteria bacterium]|nr:glucose 1-dehydrogenase [Betaproteobacteria bacterium]
MSGRLAGRVAVVTGGGSGFGAAIATRFAREGASIVVADIDAARGAAVAGAIEQSGGRAIATVTDVADGRSFDALVALTTRTFGGIDIFVNNAGVSQRFVPLDEVREDEFDRLFAVNVKAQYWCGRSVVPVLRQRGRGVILNTASASAIRPRPSNTWYAASKAAVVAGTRAMALELAPHKIRVCALCPIIADTPLLASALSPLGDRDEQLQAMARMLQQVPLGRLCAPDDMANAALFLASDEAGFLTGVCLEVDGGRCI